MGKLAFILLWCFVFAMPWEEVIQLPLLGSIPRLVGGVASVAALLHVVHRGRVRPLSWFHVLALLFVLWAGLSDFWSTDPEATRERFQTYVQLAALVWLIWELAWLPRHQDALLRAYVLGACVAAVGTIHNYMSGVSIEPGAARFAGLNSNPNELGLTAVLALPMAWYLSLSHPSRRIAWMYQLYLLLGMTAILLTASRGALLAALVALGIIPWTLGRLRFRTKAALYALAVASLMLAHSFVPEASLRRIETTSADIETGHFGGRGVIWKSAFELVREHPLAGVGAGAFESAITPMLGHRRNSHATILSVLVEQGVVGLMLFLGMAAAALSHLRRQPAMQRAFSIVVVAAMAVGSLSAAWDYRKPLWFVFGLIAAQAAVARELRVALRADKRRVGSGVPHAAGAPGEAGVAP
jgi:O-antigen ligase